MEVSIRVGPGRVAHCSGALLVEATGTLLIADAHLGYGWAQRRKGQLGPVTDGGIATRLLAAVDDVQPAEVLFLGDTVHAPRPSATERAFIDDVMARLMAKAKVTVVTGNHDRAFKRDFGHLAVRVESEWRHGEMLAMHGDRLHIELPEAAHYLIGHVHPAIMIRDDAGAKRRMPAFLVSERMTLLPAFSPFAAGLDISENALPEAVTEILGKHKIYPVTGRHIIELPAAALRAMRAEW